MIFTPRASPNAIELYFDFTSSRRSGRRAGHRLNLRLHIQLPYHGRTVSDGDLGTAVRRLFDLFGEDGTT